MVAIKVERVDSKKQVLKLEVAVLKKLQRSVWVVGFIACGRHQDFYYMVMELLGDNISEIRRKQPGAKFSMLTTCKLGIQMLRALESIHDMGYLHRDIKPSNFAMGMQQDKKGTAFLIDFGLARKYVLGNGEVRPARELTGFRGTARYASINSHLSRDLGRRDDLWSILYLLIEFCTGSLPWRRIKDKDQVGDMKVRYPMALLLKGLPREFAVFASHLESLRFEDRPNYQHLITLLEGLFFRLGGDDNTYLDWEQPVLRKPLRPRPIVSLQNLAFVKVVSELDRYAESFELATLSPALKQRVMQFLIRINNGRVSRNFLAALLDPRLKELDLISCDFQEGDLKLLSTSCTSLRSLSLGAVTDSIVKDILASNRALEELSVYGSSRLSMRSVKTIGEASSALRVLKLKCSDKVNDKAVEYILRTCLNLEELCLFGCKKFKGQAFSVYTKKKKCAPLRKLDLSYCDLSKKGFRLMRRMCLELTALRFTPLQTNFKITPSEFLTLIQGCPHLELFDLGTYHFEMDTILIELTRYCPSIKTLLLDGVGMTDFGLHNVVQACLSLHTLRFRYGDGVTESSLYAIAQYCTNLRSLTLDFWNKFNQLCVSDGAIKKLLTMCTQLQELSLCNCMVLTSGFLPEGGYFPALEKLNLSDCVQMNDAGVKRIADSCPNLRRLELNNLNNLTEASLVALSQGCAMLEELSLVSCSCFTDDALRMFLKSMVMVFVQVTRYTDFDLRGTLKELHITTCDDIFSRYPNTYRERAYEKSRRRLFGLSE